MSKTKSLLSLMNLSRPVFCVSFNSNSSLSLAQGSGSSKPSWTPLGLCTLNTLHKNILWLALPSISRINLLLSASSTTPWSISHLNNYSPCDWSSCFNSCSLKVYVLYIGARVVLFKILILLCLKSLHGSTFSSE